MNKIHIQNRMVPDPSMTDAEFLHQKASNPDKRNVGMVYVQENSLARIGALCFIRKRLRHHEMAAERFKNLYESRYGSAMTTDPARIQVDTSHQAHDSGMASKIDGTSSLRMAEVKLGKRSFDRLVALIVLGAPAGEGLHWRKRTGAVDEVLDDLDELSRIWGYQQRAA